MLLPDPDNPYCSKKDIYIYVCVCICIQIIPLIRVRI